MINMYICLKMSVQILQNLNESKTLRKHTYANILKFLPPKNENFQIKNSVFFFLCIFFFFFFFFIFLLKTQIMGTR